MTLTGQAMRSIAMIHASTNFAHQVAFDKRSNHQLVTSGVYACVTISSTSSIYTSTNLLILTIAGSATRPTPGSTTGP